MYFVLISILVTLFKSPETHKYNFELTFKEERRYYYQHFKLEGEKCINNTQKASFDKYLFLI